LARDLGLACGSRAYLTSLKRIQVGPFDVSNAVTGEAIRAESALPLKDVFNQLNEISIVTVDGTLEAKIKNGVPLFRDQLKLDDEKIEKIAVFSENGKMLCMLNNKKSFLSYHFVIN